jgi:hypothetical protein
MPEARFFFNVTLVVLGVFWLGVGIATLINRFV